MHPAPPVVVIDDAVDGPDGTEAVHRADTPGRLPENPRPGSPRSWLTGAGILVLLAVPLAIALVVLANPRWYPVLDNAQTELRLRDVGSSDPPLIGLGGRIGTAENPGSHPGPLSFWALWPFYQLFGASAWAMHAASVTLHLIAMGAILWIAHRRGGAPLVLGAGAALAVLAHAYGPATMIEPWNPYLPVLWWVAFLLACWSVLCDDLPMLPVAAFAGSFCAQTHIPYLGLVGGVGALTLAAVAVKGVRRRQPGRHRPDLPYVVRWTGVAVVVGALAWLPPIIDELTRSPGNLSIIKEHFSSPPEAPIGVGRAVELVLLHLNPWRLLTAQQFLTGSVVPGLAVLAAWAASVAVAWQRRHGALLRLHLVVGAALALAVVSASRIFGFVWYYLVLWAWGLCALVLVTIAWTAALVVADRLEGHKAKTHTAGRAAAATLAALTIGMAALFAVESATVDVPAPQRSEVLGQMVAPTIDALASGTVPGGGRDGRYLVTWVDPVHIGAHGYGLLNELERAGFDVGVINGYRAAATEHRVREAADATAVVHMSVGPDIDRWRAKPGVEQVAYVEPRSRAQQVEYLELREEVVAELEVAGLADLVPLVDGNLFLATFDPRVPEALKDQMVRMADLGLPFAVFVGPPSAAD
jgi:hypothetical protein